MLKSNILCIVGPTASGKTTLALLVAKKINSEIISTDSRQVYHHLNIGTAKPTAKELEQVPHHFISFVDLNKEYNAGEFGLQARSKIQDILNRHKCPILVGGSGLYLRAVIDGLFNGPGKNEEVRRKLEEERLKYGASYLYDKLMNVDQLSAKKMDETKVRRVIRALEVYYTTGKPLSELHKNQKTETLFNFKQFGLAWERQILYQRIEQRVEKMIELGLIQEVQKLKEQGYNSSINALNTVGYKEVLNYLDGLITKETMIDLIKKNTRNFAKRQMTWFRADKRIRWIQVYEKTDWNDIAEQVVTEFQRSEHIPKPN
jgi:tRNA dimethylallyltransferase